MTEKVYCVYDWWDMTIISGVAEYNNKKYYFKCNFDFPADDWSDIYELTFLDDYIFKLSMENWEYWKIWLKQSIIPHPQLYAKSRETMTVKEIFSGKNIEKRLIEQTENYYQNELIINEYIENTKPVYKAKAAFQGKIDGMDTRVEWKNISNII